jgi:hypothetical protein
LRRRWRARDEEIRLLPALEAEVTIR